MSHFGDFEHHFQVFVEDYIPNIWVMFNGDIYQPLFRFHIDYRCWKQNEIRESCSFTTQGQEVERMVRPKPQAFA